MLACEHRFMASSVRSSFGKSSQILLKVFYDVRFSIHDDWQGDIDGGGLFATLLFRASRCSRCKSTISMRTSSFDGGSSTMSAQAVSLVKY